jgi:hypothetical protein
VTSIQVTRRLQYQELFGRWFVYIDEVQVGKLRRGRPVVVTTTRGQHTLTVASKGGRTRSNALELDLTQVDSIRLKCEVNPGYMRMVLSNGPLQNFRLAGSAMRNQVKIIDLSVQDG